MVSGSVALVAPRRASLGSPPGVSLQHLGTEIRRQAHSMVLHSNQKVDEMRRSDDALTARSIDWRARSSRRREDGDCNAEPVWLLQLFVLRLGLCRARPNSECGPKSKMHFPSFSFTDSG